MSTQVMVEGVVTPRGRRGVARPVLLGLAGGLLALLVGDGAGMGANAVQGIDPLDILNLQVRPNIVFVVDTSRNMGTPPDDVTRHVGGDDPKSRLYQIKVALREAIADNEGSANFGIVDMSSNPSNVAIDNAGELLYVSEDKDAAHFATDLLGARFSSTPPVYKADHSTVCSGGSCPDKDLFDSFSTVNYTTDYFDRFYIRSAAFRTGVKYTWDFSNPVVPRVRGVDTFDCNDAIPPAGMLGDDTANANDGTEPRACFVFEDSDTGEKATYFYTSPVLGSASADNGVAVETPECTAPDNAADLALALKLERTLASNGNPSTLDTGSDPLGQSDNTGGLQLGPALRTLNGALGAAQSHIGTLPAVSGQSNFVILITGNDWVTNGDGVDPTATITAMYGAGIQTVVVAFNSDPALNMTNLNALQSAGSLGKRQIAYRAADAESVRRAVNIAVSEAIASGTFSTESSITESIYEYAGVPGDDPNDPGSRYSRRVPVLLQSSFDMPGFVGHLKAFRNAASGTCPLPGMLVSSNVCQLWDAGQKLRDRLWGPAGGPGMCPGVTTGLYPDCLAAQQGADTSKNYTFAELHGSTEPTSPMFAPGDARIQRRVFTTSRNGVFKYAADFSEPFGPSTEQAPVPLWPPTRTGTSAVAPSDTASYPAGLVDGGLGIATLSFAELQSKFGACLGTAAPAACAFNAGDTSSPTIQTRHARKEAREMILAFMAGAQVAQDAGGLPRRSATSGELLYQARSWFLAESTLAVPAVVPPPLEARPVNHTAEYLLYRDGIRDPNGAASATDGGQQTESGLGLRNPDKGSPTSHLTDPEFKPLMTVVYHAANDMLHAFRAGPCPTTNPVTTCTETGGEELYGFVPFDQLSKLSERLQAQGRNPHIYMLASSVRFTDLFVPSAPFQVAGTGTAGAARTYVGRWRTVMVIGRGIAGKYYTALDITAPGAFNKNSLATQPAFPVWTRGNPDTQDGTPTGTANSATAASDVGDVDLTSYATMGETWSVPAIAGIPPDPNYGKEFGLFTGSGYSTNHVSTEGKTFYVMDALSGDILHARAVQDAPDCPGAAGCTENALVANPAAYVAVQLAPGFVGNPAASAASTVYVGDVQGRMWKYVTSSPSIGMILLKDAGAIDGRNQAIGAAAGLLNIGNTPYVYFETGNDLRVNAPPNFNLWAVRDDLQDKSPFCDAPATGYTGCAGTYNFPALFHIPFEGVLNGIDLAGFRGTAQPATAFNDQKKARVFFIGTKLTDQPASCRGRFDSVLFAVGGVSGDAVYDLDAAGGITNTLGDKAATISGKVNALRGSLGQIVLDKGDVGASAPQAPPAPSAITSVAEGSSGDVATLKIRSGSPVCR